MRVLLIVISNVLTLAAALPYLRETIAGKARPRLASWFIWASLTGIGSAAAFAQHQIPAAIYGLLCSIECLAIVVLGFRHGERKLERLELICLIGAFAGLVVLVLLRSSNLAIIITIATDFVGGVPTIKHAWIRPAEETTLTYILNALGSGVTLMIANFHVFSAVGYPLYLFLFDATIAGAILTSPHRLKSQSEQNVSGGEPTTIPALPRPSLASPAAPASLAASSPSPTPTLSWRPAIGATGYNVYRNDIKIATTQGAFYTDSTAPDGSWQYGVTAVNEAAESAKSNPLSVLVDRTPPTLSYSLDYEPNAGGWHNRPVTVAFTASDAKAGIASCSPAVTLDKDGPNQTVIGYAMNYAGDSTSLPVVVNLDQTPPTLGAPAWSQNPVPQGATVSLTVPAADHTSGIAQAECFFGADPGAGRGQPMQITDGSLTAGLQAAAPGSFTVYIRAKDMADNWSALVSSSFVVR